MEMQGLPAPVVNFICDMQQMNNHELLYFISCTPKAGKLTLIWRPADHVQSMHPALTTPSWRKYKTPSQQKRDSKRFKSYKNNWRNSKSGPHLQSSSPGLSPVVAEAPSTHIENRICDSLLDQVDFKQPLQASSSSKSVAKDSQKDLILDAVNMVNLDEKTSNCNDNINMDNNTHHDSSCSSTCIDCDLELTCSRHCNLNAMNEKCVAINQVSGECQSSENLKTMPNICNKDKSISYHSGQPEITLPDSQSEDNSVETESGHDTGLEITPDNIVLQKVTYDYRDSSNLKLRASIDKMLVFYDLSRNKRYCMDPKVDGDDDYDYCRHMNVHERFPYVYPEDIESHQSWNRNIDLAKVMNELKESMVVLLKRRKDKNVAMPDCNFIT